MSDGMSDVMSDEMSGEMSDAGASPEGSSLSNEERERGNTRECQRRGRTQLKRNPNAISIVISIARFPFVNYSVNCFVNFSYSMSAKKIDAVDGID